jgi:GAF domain-containing protein
LIDALYSGTPLVSSDNKRLGSLCIIDDKPRKFDAESGRMLSNFGEMVVRELEKEKMLALSREESARLAMEKSQLLRAINVCKCVL